MIVAGGLASKGRGFFVGGISRVSGSGFATGSFVPLMWVLDAVAGSSSYSTEANAQGIVGSAGTLKNMRAIVGPGTQDAGTQTYTLRKNAADTGITFTIVNTDAAGLLVTISGSLTVSANDKLCWKMTNSGVTNDDRGCVITVEMEVS